MGEGLGISDLLFGALPPQSEFKMKEKLKEISKGTVIYLAWQDHISFEEIEKRTNLTEDVVIQLMRRELKPRSFRLWRKRVSGRATKHCKRFKAQRENRRTRLP